MKTQVKKMLKKKISQKINFNKDKYTVMEIFRTNTKLTGI